MKTTYAKPQIKVISTEMESLLNLSLGKGTTPSPGGGDAKQDFTDDDEMENNMSPTTPSSLWED